VLPVVFVVMIRKSVFRMFDRTSTMSVEVVILSHIPTKCFECS
jgi:hypothetical protein